MDACINHPELAAVEACEVCSKPLCGLCLWYTSDGHRLCETHAKEREEAGEVVLSPETYREALPNSLEPRPDRPVADPSQRTVYQGNSYDLTALIAAIVGVTTLASCCGGAYCLPFVGLTLGIIAFVSADQAIDSVRTRNLAIVGIAVMGLIAFAILAFIILYAALIGVALVAGP
jgi:hypothetical protein